MFRKIGALVGLLLVASGAIGLGLPYFPGSVDQTGPSYYSGSMPFAAHSLPWDYELLTVPQQGAALKALATRLATSNLANNPDRAERYTSIASALGLWSRSPMEMSSHATVSNPPSPADVKALMDAELAGSHTEDSFNTAFENLFGVNRNTVTQLIMARPSEDVVAAYELITLPQEVLATPGTYSLKLLNGPFVDFGVTLDGLKVVVPIEGTPFIEGLPPTPTTGVDVEESLKDIPSGYLLGAVALGILLLILAFLPSRKRTILVPG